MNEKTVCSVCGVILTGGAKKEFNDQIMCEDCFDEQTVVCDNCGKIILKTEAEGDSVYTLCSNCYQYHYTNCENCGTLIHQNDAYYEDDDSDYPYCYDCYQKLQQKSIRSYNYKPEPIFYGSGNVFYGVELEVDKGGEDDTKAQILLDIANRNCERLYCKHDGSLNMGFELISHPLTLDYHINTMNWRNIFEKAIEMGYRSHDTSTSGLHIHVNRTAFGKTYEQQEQAIGRVVFFVERHWNELVKFSRRTLENLNHWAARYATISNTTEETYKKAKDKRLGRYVAVNLENDETVEFRLFRGTLCYKTFIGALQLVDEIVYWATNLTDRDMEELSWSEFVSKIPPKKYELIEYLKSKRLYVNDIVTESEEM